MSDVRATRSTTLVDLVDRLLDQGVVLAGDVKISVAGVDLIRLNLLLLLSSEETAALRATALPASAIPPTAVPPSAVPPTAVPPTAVRSRATDGDALDSDVPPPQPDAGGIQPPQPDDDSRR